ncbi:TonB-dependent receptor [Pseudoalteromonas xiamenensis]|uniref:TonB-dependent receptor n=1 Tax=Pseudoalteromonas xiamenensis TaxID=882626 RepID=UPI0035EA756E
MFKLSAITLGLLSVFGSFGASANMEADKSDTAHELEVIEVYAQKRNQQISDVPVTVTVVKGLMLDDNGIKDVTELGRFSSNLKISQNAAEGTTPTINIRGVGLIDYNTANTAPIGIYVDGNPVGSGNNQLVNLFDVEQIEVLKGPQGTMFGRNSTGGAILIRSVRPTFENEGYFQIGAGTDAYKEAEGAVNHVWSKDLAMRLSFSHKKYEYTTDNLYAASPEAGMEQNNVRLGIKQVWDNSELYVQARYGHWNGVVQPVGNIGVYADPVNLVLCSPQDAGSSKCYDRFGFNDGSDSFWDVAVNNNSPHHTRSKGLSIEYQWFFSDRSTVTLHSQISTLDRLHHFNCDGSPANLCEGYLGLDNDFYSNELLLQSQFESGHLTVGLFQQHEEINQDNENDILRDLRGIAPASLTATFKYDNEIKSSDFGVFTQYDWLFSENDVVTIGARISHETLDYDSVADLNVVPVPQMIEGVWIPFYHVNGDESDTKLSGKLAWNHHFNESLSGFYSFSTGTKSGGYNGGFLSSLEQAELAYYGPESLNAHELGFRFNSQDKQTSANGAVFWYDYKDQQVFMNQPSSDPNQLPLQLLENVGTSTIYGAEFELRNQITPQLQTALTLGYIPKAEFDEFVDPAGVVLTNNRLPFTSKFNGTADLYYTLSMYPIKFNVGVDYQSEYFFDQKESDYAKQDGFALWHANLWYTKDNWTVGVWGKNLLNEEYSHLKFDLSNFLGMLEDFKGEGRRLGISVKYAY